MGIINGAFLWGLGLASIPVIIHLLNRRRFRVIEWAAMDWLLEADLKNRRRVRLEHLLLLLLRCALLALLALLISRPFAERGSILAGAAAFETIEHVVVLDDSMSMGQQLAEGSPWRHGIKVLDDLVARIESERGGDRITIIRSSAADVPLIAEAPIVSQSVTQLVRQLRDTAASEQTLSPARTLSVILERIEGTRGKEGGKNAQVIVITDLRRVDWIDSEELPEVVGRYDDAGVPLRIIDVGTDEVSNVAVVGVETTSRHAIAGVPLRVRIAIKNFGRDPVRGLQLHRRFGPLPQVSRAAAPPPEAINEPIGPGETRIVPVDVTFNDPGHFGFEAKLNGDRLEADDHRYLAVEVRSAIRALLVDGEPSGARFDSETDFLRFALGPGGGVRSGIDVDVVTESELGNADLDDYDVVFLCNVYSLTEPIADGLEKFVGDGGGLVLFLGDQVDPGQTNSLLWKGGKGLLPAAIGELRGDVERPAPVAFSPATFDHPLLREFRDRGEILLRTVKIYAYYDVRRETIVEPARVVMPYSDVDLTPAIVEKPFGKGRVMMFTTSADREWTSWPTSPSFLIIAQELVRYAARGSDAELQVEVGHPIERYLAPSETDGRVDAKLPGWPVVPPVQFRAAGVGGEDPRLILKFTQTGRAGVYEFGLSRPGEEPTVLRYAANVDPAESDLARPRTDEVSKRLGGVTVISRAEASEIRGSESRVEIWPTIAFLILGLMMLESILGYVFGHHVRTEGASVIKKPLGGSGLEASS